MVSHEVAWKWVQLNVCAPFFRYSYRIANIDPAQESKDDEAFEEFSHSPSIAELYLVSQENELRLLASD